MSRLSVINDKLKSLYENNIKQAKLFLEFNEINIQSKEITKILKKWIKDTEAKLEKLNKK